MLFWNAQTPQRCYHDGKRGGFIVLTLMRGSGAGEKACLGSMVSGSSRSRKASTGRVMFFEGELSHSSNTRSSRPCTWSRTARETHSARRTHGRSRRYIHAVAMQVGAIGNYVADVNANSTDVPVRGLIAIVVGHCCCI